MNYIEDPTFLDIADRTVCHNSNKMISPHWWIKTLDSTGEIKCIASKENGLRIDALYTGSGYIYVRQEIPGVMKFSGKKLTLTAIVNRASWQNLYCDVYVQAKLCADGSRRVLVVDTQSKYLDMGGNTITVELNVPDLSNELIEDGSTLQSAVRFIGQDQNTMFYINSVKIEDETSDKLTPAQYEAVCKKIRELM